MLAKKIVTAEVAIGLAKESRDNDTKSSAGDKYETGRAMMQLEMDKNEAQKSKILNLKRELSRINVQKEYSKAEFGSLIASNQGNYFISVGIGKMELANKIYYSVSLVSPIGKLLHNKKVGDKFLFQKKEFVINSIV